MTGDTALNDPFEIERRFVESLARSALSLARRFSAGGTLWCLAPGRHHDALHVAVEFVHPVIVGKPALPAVPVAEWRSTATLRNRARQGDTIIFIGAGDEPDLTDIARRAPAWGIETLWLGWGAGPHEQSSASTIWLADGDSASVVRAYHLLWELTHVCLEHPAVLNADDGLAGAVCKVCSDDLVLAEVAAVTSHDAEVRTASGTVTVDTTLVGPVEAHDLVLIHAGTALQKVDELTP